MSKIVYLLGAGASFGKRDTEKPKIEVHGALTDSNVIGTRIAYEYANIVEGLPLVTEIPGRLAYIIETIKNCSCSDKTANLIFPLGASGGTGFNTAKEMLIKDLEWLKTASESHATIDTFAKKLFLKKEYKDFYKVESLLSIFFIIEQVINKKDGRYDTFLASTLDSNLNIDNRITILTWNYDSQFELAYKEYAETKDASSIRRKLGIADLKEQSYDTRNQIFKLNGTANFMSQIDINLYKQFDENLLTELLDAYIRGYNEDDSNSHISFAWDNTKYMSGDFENALLRVTQDTEILVVIGYTFPFFNRGIDRKIFQYMERLKKIYIQDPNATQIIASLDSLYTAYHTGSTHVNRNVTPITNTTQFYLPPEL
uniref:hypothetical protein n=1 Tax=Alistipes sp. TaxID=1872444 RepID=UPI004056960C